MKKKKNGKNTTPCFVYMIETIAKVEKVVIRDLSGETCLSYDAEKEMKICASADRALETAYIAIACEQGCYSDRLAKMWEAAGV